MSTDDSVSEDVSSSGAHACADGEKESEASLLSSEGTSAVSEERHTISETTGGTVEKRSIHITPACNRIRNLCLSTDEAIEHGKNLPFINPSSLETLRALMQEIQSSGETDPEIWKDCEDRWLHLFQLVEKQYQEQILAQQEQYQCQIQLIQDEIKTLVQLQNRQASVLPQMEFTPNPVTKSAPKDYILGSGACTTPHNVPSDSDSLAAPPHSPFSSPSPPPPRSEERATTVLSSGYGTLSAWDTGPEPAGSPGGDGRSERWPSSPERHTEMTGSAHRKDGHKQRTVMAVNLNASLTQQKSSCSRLHLTSWAQRQKLRPKKNHPEPASPQNPDNQELLHGPSETSKQAELDHGDSQEQDGSAEPSRSCLPLRRSDSLLSDTSGLTYWRLNECDLYRPLPDSFDSSAYLLLHEASVNLTPAQEPRLSLREIYQNKQRDCKQANWEDSATSSPLSPQVVTLDPAAAAQHSNRTSGFTSPSHFSSPSYAAPLHALAGTGPSITPDSMAAESLHNPDTECNSEASSVSAAGQPPAQIQGSRATPSQAASSVSRETTKRFHLAGEEEQGHTSRLKPHADALRPTPASHKDRAASLDDPVVLSLLRQNLREKHSRHITDLKAYYEAEIEILRDKLKLRDLPKDLEKSNLALTERCKHLEKALADATSRVQELESTNGLLETKLAEWPERYAVAAATVKSLQQRLEESKRSGKEKDSLAARLRTRVRQLEEAGQRASREANEKEARRLEEFKVLQDLSQEYDSLVKEHEALKRNFVSVESKLVGASDQISELKRVVSKLESQVKQLEHENQARLRYMSHNVTQPSGAGLFHHPDLLLSPSRGKKDPEANKRRSVDSLGDQPRGGSKSPFSQTNTAGVQMGALHLLSEQSSVDGSCRCGSPPECEQSSNHGAALKENGRKEGSSPLTPVMRALIELEETKATECRAPWVGHQRATVGFMERKLKEPIPQRAELQQPEERGDSKRRGGMEQAAALLRAQRSLSPQGHRSSSLPPPALRNIPSTTPTKRETLLMPLSAKSSPKRCPTENFSTAFGHLMPRQEHLLQRPDEAVDRRRHSLHSSSSPRRRLQFVSADPPDLPESESSSHMRAVSGPDPTEDLAESSPQRAQSLAEAEQLFDELTQEKLQIEAALSRMPGAGGRVSLQTRLNEVALENRLDRLNRELGSLRMTLKRFHVLRSSANV